MYTLRALELLAFSDVSAPDLAASLKVNPRTARRLLKRLAAEGVLSAGLRSLSTRGSVGRSHGFAVIDTREALATAVASVHIVQGRRDAPIDGHEI
jgi:predicted ArsR family transcriptional regulator